MIESSYKTLGAPKDAAPVPSMPRRVVAEPTPNATGARATALPPLERHIITPLRLAGDCGMPPLTLAFLSGAPPPAVVELSRGDARRGRVALTAREAGGHVVRFDCVSSFTQPPLQELEEELVGAAFRGQQVGLKAPSWFALERSTDDGSFSMRVVGEVLEGNVSFDIPLQRRRPDAVFDIPASEKGDADDDAPASGSAIAPGTGVEKPHAWGTSAREARFDDNARDDFLFVENEEDEDDGAARADGAGERDNETADHSAKEELALKRARPDAGASGRSKVGGAKAEAPAGGAQPREVAMPSEQAKATATLDDEAVVAVRAMRQTAVRGAARPARDVMKDLLKVLPSFAEMKDRPRAERDKWLADAKASAQRALRVQGCIFDEKSITILP